MIFVKYGSTAYLGGDVLAIGSVCSFASDKSLVKNKSNSNHENNSHVDELAC